MALMGVFLVYPTIRTIWLSLHDRTGEAFVGLANFQTLFSSEAFLTSVRNNLLWVIAFPALVLFFGLVIAVLADRVPYEGPVKSLIFLPMAISFVASAVIWKFMYDYQPPGYPQTGTLNGVVTTFGGEPMTWLINQPWNNLALIVVAVWGFTGFAMVLLSAALKGIAIELLEAARVDGAGEVRIFRSIILPLLMPTVAVLSTTLIIFALKAFDIVYVMTSGNFGTDVLGVLMYKQLFNVRDFGQASAVAVILLIAIIPVLVVNLRRFRFEESMR